MNNDELLGCVLSGLEEDGEKLPAPSRMADLELRPNERVVPVEAFMPTSPRTRRVLTEGKRTKQKQGGEKRGSMRAKYIGKTDFLVLTHGKLYEILSVEKDWYRVIDDSGEDYLYPPELFELLEN